jgi:hypothetical protein
MIPTTRDELLKDVNDGLGDIAAGNLTATDERRNTRTSSRSRRS